MNDRLNSNIGRRGVLLAVAAGAGVAATGPVPLAVIATKTPTTSKTRRARYPADSLEVETGRRVGSAKFTNETAYLNRQFAAFWGTNNSDHQARICHSTTVAGVTNTWAYGSVTRAADEPKSTCKGERP